MKASRTKPKNHEQAISMLEKMTIARPYAKAVFECARESETIAEWAQALFVLSKISEEKAVKTLLREEVVSKEAWVELFGAVCKSSLGERLHNFIRLLVYRKRLLILPEIQWLYKEMQLDAENRVEVQFEAPVYLDKSQEEAYQKIFEKHFGRKITLQCTINTSLLGGFLAKAGNFVIDGSVLGSLTNLKKAMGN